MSVEDKDARIAQLEAELVASGAQLINLETELAAKAAQLIGLEAELAAKGTRLVKLEAEVLALRKQVEVLMERLGQNSSNSNLPPSSDPPGKPKDEGKPKKDKKNKGKRGGQRGHRGNHRELPLERVSDPRGAREQVDDRGGGTAATASSTTGSSVRLEPMYLITRVAAQGSVRAMTGGVHADSRESPEAHRSRAR